MIKILLWMARSATLLTKWWGEKRAMLLTIADSISQAIKLPNG
jgi:hypothetical protein